MKIGDAVTYVCREYRHNALILEINGDTISLLHIVSPFGKPMPQCELNVTNKPDTDGRYYEVPQL